MNKDVENKINKILSLKRKIELLKPNLNQYENRDSAPFFCSLCGMDEFKISKNKEKNKYFCRCSYWSDSHNAYLDKSGGKWLGWKDKKYAQKMIEEYSNEDNGYNKAIDDVIAIIKKIER